MVMDLIEFRDFCLSLGDVTEKTPFGKFSRRYDSLLVFYVAGHMFCIIDLDDFTYVDLPVTSDDKSELQATYTSVTTPLNRGLRYWVQLNLGGDIPDGTILTLVRTAHSLIKVKYSSKKSL